MEARHPTFLKGEVTNGNVTQGNSQVHVLVQLCGEVPWHILTAIIIAVVLRNVVNVVKYQTVPIQILHCFNKADIKEHCTVKWLIPRLQRKNNISQRAAELGQYGKY